MNDFFLKSFSSSKYLPYSSIVYSTIKLIQTFEEVDFLTSCKYLPKMFLPNIVWQGCELLYYNGGSIDIILQSRAVQCCSSHFFQAYLQSLFRPYFSLIPKVTMAILHSHGSVALMIFCFSILWLQITISSTTPSKFETWLEFEVSQLRPFTQGSKF